MKYIININTDTSCPCTMKTEADNYQTALNNIADEIEKKGLAGLYKTYDEFLDEARGRKDDYRNEAELEDEANRLIDEYGYVCVGKNKIYLNIDSFSEEC